MEAKQQKTGMRQVSAGMNGLAESDPHRISELYRELYGCSVEEMELACGTCSIFRLGERLLGGILRQRGESTFIPPVWIPFVTVGKLKEAVSRATSIGSRICSDIAYYPGIGCLAIIMNPQGVMVGMWEPGMK